MTGLQYNSMSASLNSTGMYAQPFGTLAYRITPYSYNNIPGISAYFNIHSIGLHNLTYSNVVEWQLSTNAATLDMYGNGNYQTGNHMFIHTLMFVYMYIYHIYIFIFVHTYIYAYGDIVYVYIYTTGTLHHL